MSFREGIIVHFKSSGSKWNHNVTDFFKVPLETVKPEFSFLCPVPMICPRGAGCSSLTSEQAPSLERGQAPSSCSPSLPRPNNFPQQLHPRGTAQSRWLAGARVKLTLNFRLNFSFSGGLKVNFCRSEVKKINNSVLANCSPRHIRFPERQKCELPG